MSRCLKKRHGSRDAAVTAAAVWMSKFADLKPMGVYRCGVCGTWHIGHRGRSVPLPKAKKADVERQQPSKPRPEEERCQMNCSKPFTDIVTTPNGTFRVCGHHRNRMPVILKRVLAGDAPVVAGAE